MATAEQTLDLLRDWLSTFPDYLGDVRGDPEAEIIQAVRQIVGLHRRNKPDPGE